MSPITRYQGLCIEKLQKTGSITYKCMFCKYRISGQRGLQLLNFELDKDCPSTFQPPLCATQSYKFFPTWLKKFEVEFDERVRRWLLPREKLTDPGLGSRDGTVVRALASRQCGLGSIPELRIICGLSLFLVPALVPRGYSSFPSPQKPTFLNSNSI